MERAATHGRTIIVDLRRVSYLDGTGFRVLEEACAQARHERRAFWIIPSRNVERLVALLHLQDVMPLSASLEDALGRALQPVPGTQPDPTGNGVGPSPTRPDATPAGREKTSYNIGG